MPVLFCVAILTVGFFVKMRAISDGLIVNRILRV
jgi:hypothetical protein